MRENPRGLKGQVSQYIETTIFPNLTSYQQTDSEGSLDDSDWESLGTPETEIIPKVFDYLGFILSPPNWLADIHTSFQLTVADQFRGPDTRQELITQLGRYIKKYGPSDTSPESPPDYHLLTTDTNSDTWEPTQSMMMIL